MPARSCKERYSLAEIPPQCGFYWTSTGPTWQRNTLSMKTHMTKATPWHQMQPESSCCHRWELTLRRQCWQELQSNSSPRSPGFLCCPCGQILHRRAGNEERTLEDSSLDVCQRKRERWFGTQRQNEITNAHELWGGLDWEHGEHGPLTLLKVVEFSHVLKPCIHLILSFIWSWNIK